MQLDGTATGPAAGGAPKQHHLRRACTPSRARTLRTFRSQAHLLTPAGRRAVRSACCTLTSRPPVASPSLSRQTVLDPAQLEPRWRIRQPARRYGWTIRACGAKERSRAPKPAARASGRLHRLRRHHPLRWLILRMYISCFRIIWMLDTPTTTTEVALVLSSIAIGTCVDLARVSVASR